MFLLCWILKAISFLVCLFFSPLQYHDKLNVSSYYSRPNITEDGICDRLWQLRMFCMCACDPNNSLSRNLFTKFRSESVRHYQIKSVSFLFLFLSLLLVDPHGLTFMWWGCCKSLPTPFYSALGVSFCLYSPFNSISFYKFSWPLPVRRIYELNMLFTFSLGSSGLISALLVLSSFQESPNFSC